MALVHKTPTLPRHTALATLLSVLLTLLIGTSAAPSAQAEGHIDTVEVTSTLGSDGVLEVISTLQGKDLGRDLKMRLDTRQPLGDLRTIVHTVEDVRVTVGGQEQQPKITTDAASLTVSIDPSVAAGQDVVISYKVRGTTSQSESGADRTQFRWPLVQGFNAGISRASGAVVVPDPPPDVECQAGNQASPHSCALWNLDRHTPRTVTFQDGPLAAGDAVTLAFSQPGSVAPTAQVETRWTLDRAFSLTLGTALASLGVLLVGGIALWTWHRRLGTDEISHAAPTVIGEFHPVGDGVSEFRIVEDVRPGQIGTVADEHVDPIDVTATILDLAVRGHLRIEQIDVGGAMDWQFHRLDSDTSELHAYEELLLDAVAPASGPTVTVAGIQHAVGPVVSDLQHALYDDVVAKGWFTKHPDAARVDSRKVGAALLTIGLAVTGVLAWLTTWGLVGLSIVAIGVASLFVAGEMPRRSAKGTALLAGLHGFSAILAQQRFDVLPEGHELSEISKLLPYAVVLGGKDRWLHAMVDADRDDDPDPRALRWYHAPEDWHLQQLPYSIDALITSIQGRLFGR